MESVSQNTIFGLKMMVKSGLEIFLKYLHAGDYFPLLHKSAQNHEFSNKNPAYSKNHKFIFNYFWTCDFTYIVLDQVHFKKIYKYWIRPPLVIFLSFFEKDYNYWIKSKLPKSSFKWTGL